MSQKLIELAEHIRSMENIQAITSTMSTVAGAKLARTRRKVLGLRGYSQRLRRIVLEQSGRVGNLGPRLEKIFPLMETREAATRTLLVVLAADLGMCGQHNSRVCRAAQAVAEEQRRGGEVLLVTKGLKAQEFFEKKADLPIAFRLTWSPEGVSLGDADELVDIILASFAGGEIASVRIAYTAFRSTARQEPEVMTVLPLRLTVEPPSADAADTWFYEPGLPPILEELVPTYLRVQVYALLLESYASEQAARMMAMEDAASRADGKLAELRLRRNRIRRDLVTLDLLGILGAGQVVKRGPASTAGF